MGALAFPFLEAVADLEMAGQKVKNHPFEEEASGFFAVVAVDSFVNLAFLLAGN